MFGAQKLKETGSSSKSYENILTHFRSGISKERGKEMGARRCGGAHVVDTPRRRCQVASPSAWQEGGTTTRGPGDRWEMDSAWCLSEMAPFNVFLQFPPRHEVNIN